MEFMKIYHQQQQQRQFT